MADAPLIVFIASGLRLATPIILASTGELVSERAGVLNLSLDGMILSAAFAAAWGSFVSGSPLIGLGIALVASLLLAGMQAILSITLGANQLVVGIGFNILATGGTTFLYREIFGTLSRQTVPSFGPLDLPVLRDIPIVGPALFSQSGLVYVGLLLVVVTWALLRYTSFGLSVRASGEAPQAADKAGINVRRTRYLGVLYAGAMAGLAGAWLSIADSNAFTEGMSKGTGYLAITAVIFGGWAPWKTLGACLLIGFATALQFLVPALNLDVPVALLLMLPYVLALCAIGGLVGSARQPAALTLPLRSRH
ncbi:ABC transporter permease [Paraburkholderia oxyphila]|uniref:ABC transporter permease n=1 Tax=Paraburkholderia oxyphila TaxID=614212 RepID=UPI00047F4BBB|nr:ABC transporter permease [Paraburkholderia oxyphila]